MNEHYQSKGVSRGPARFARIFVYSVLLVAVVVFVLPFTQHLLQVQEKRTVRTVDVALPPPPPPPPEPPPPQEEKVEQPAPELQSQPKPLSLSQLQLAMNPGTGNALGSAFGMGSFDVDTNALDEIQTFSMAELDEKPRLLRQPQWTPPRNLIGRIKDAITFTVLYEIDREGRVEFRRFERLSHEMASEAAVEYLESLRYTVPKKDGVAVRMRGRTTITLEL